ncbi:disulfide bond formation protein DsbB [Solimonas aquatica]|uniref:Disulfide bond formation protein B n=1 Tax=Solimonas aquatica TaxID=489703 RepID=A0A1H9IJL0_9GAMM|nr:disulfide bond formation protein B [Solimonas aquatica]SEQ74790.1 disulfide bond formation protein DsbB [Solimonas aquatica]
MLRSFRGLSFLGFVACFGGLAFAIVYLQRTLGFEPCPMCIFQRVAMAAAGLAFLLGALHNPRGAGRWVYALLALLAAAIGAGIAGRHVWLQSLPADQVPACGPTLDYLLSFLPITEVVTMILKGDGNCAKIDAQWLGLSLPAWTLVAFIAFALYAVAIPILSRKTRSVLS